MPTHGRNKIDQHPTASAAADAFYAAAEPCHPLKAFLEAKIPDSSKTEKLWPSAIFPRLPEALQPPSSVSIPTPRFTATCCLWTSSNIVAHPWKNPPAAAAQFASQYAEAWAEPVKPPLPVLWPEPVKLPLPAEPVKLPLPAPPAPPTAAPQPTRWIDAPDGPAFPVVVPPRNGRRNWAIEESQWQQRCLNLARAHHLDTEESMNVRKSWFFGKRAGRPAAALPEEEKNERQRSPLRRVPSSSAPTILGSAPKGSDTEDVERESSMLLKSLGLVERVNLNVLEPDVATYDKLIDMCKECERSDLALIFLEARMKAGMRDAGVSETEQGAGTRY